MTFTLNEYKSNFNLKRNSTTKRFLFHKKEVYIMDCFCTGNMLYVDRNGKNPHISHLCETEFSVFDFTPVMNTFYNEHFQLPCKLEVFN